MFDTLSDRLGGIFDRLRGRGALSEDDVGAAMREIRVALLEADVALPVVRDFIAAVREKAVGQDVIRSVTPGQMVVKIVHDHLVQMLAGDGGRSGSPTGGLDLNAPSPVGVMLVGLQGSGKTTTAAKLAHRFKEAGDTVLVAACDTFRAAAIEQLAAWAKRLDLELVSNRAGADAAAVAFDAVKAGRSRARDWVIIDTAGRLHTKGNLMEELQKMRRVVAKADPTAPHHAWLVVDGSLGVNSVEQARSFQKSFGLTGLIVTKLDGTSKGGALAAIWRELRLPVYFVGLGEEPGDLQPFNASDYVAAIFGSPGPGAGEA
jgi:fused signal recognition particle receptor